MSRRYLPILMATVMLLTAACTKSPPQRTLPAGADTQPDQKTLRIGVFVQGQNLKPIIEAYEATHENLHIEAVPFDTYPAIQQAVETGKVDLFVAGGLSSSLVRTGKAVDLDPYIRKSQFDTAPLADVMDAHRTEGKVHALPIHGDPYVLVYNKQLMADAGVTIPAASLTWDQLRDIAQKLTRGKGLTKQWGMSVTFPLENLAYTMALEMAGPGRTVGADHVETALRYFHTLIFSDESVPPSTGGQSPPPLYFDQGRAAISYMGLSQLRRMPADKAPGIAPPPAHQDSQPVVLLSVTSMAISGASAKQDEAWEFLAYAAGPEGAKAMAMAGYFPLYATDAVHQTWLSASPPPPAGIEPVLKATWYPASTSWSTGTPFGVYMQAARDVLTGDTTVDLAMRTYRADMAQFK